MVYCVVLYVLGGDGRADVYTIVSTWLAAEFFLRIVLTLTNRQRYREVLILNDYL